MNASETRRRGRKWAAGLAGLALAVVAIAILNRPAPVGPTPTAQDTEAPPGGTEQVENSTQLSQASDVRIVVVDDETGAITAIMTADKMEPIDETNYVVTNPRLTQFPDGGQTVFIRADFADIHVPKGQERPDHGTMRGNVETRLFDPVPQGVDVDVDRDRPTLTAETETLQFDLTLGQVSTQDPIRVIGDEFEMQGVGMEWMMNFADRSLNSMRITRGRFARFVPLGGSGMPNLVSPSPKRTNPTPTPTQKPPEPAKKPDDRVASKPSADTPVAPAPVTRMYRIDFADDVVITQEPYKATADLLSMWVRTVDNALPEGAVPQMKDMEKHTRLEGVMFGPGIAKALASFVPAAQPEPEIASEPAELPPPTEIRWTGPMIVTPIAEVPEQLAGGNDVFVRLSANKPNEVVLTDTETGSVARCDWIDYAATTQVAVIGDNADMGIDLFAPDPKNGDSWVELSTTTVDLAAGTFEVDGGGKAVNTYEGEAIEWSSSVSGELVTIGDRVVEVESMPANENASGAQSNRRVRHAFGDLVIVVGRVVEFGSGHMPGERVIEWSRHASGNLVIVDGRPVGVERALLEGDVQLSAAEGFARGDEMDVTLVPVDDTWSIRRTMFIGDAMVGNMQQESLAGDWLEIIFEPGKAVEGEQSPPTPSLITARGHVVAKQPDSTTYADSIVAELEPDGQKVTATRVEVDSETPGGVTFEGIDRKNKIQTATATRLIAFPERKAINLFGTADVPAQVTYGGLRIVGDEIQTNSDKQTVLVFGSGRLSYAADEDPDGTKLLDLSWLDEMAFDGGQGTIDGRGDIHAVLTADELSRETIDAHRLRIAMLPGENGELPNFRDVEDGDQTEEILEHIRSFEARGSVLYEDGGVDAIIRSRKYDKHGLLINAVNLSGARIIGEPSQGSQTADTLRVPGKGQLVVVDETPPTRDEEDATEETAENGTASLGEPDMRRAGLYNWKGSMSVSRATGRFEMLEEVEISHSPSADELDNIHISPGPSAQESVLYLIADSVTGTVAIPSAAEAQPDAGDDAGAGKPENPADAPLAENRIGDLREAVVSGNVYARWMGRELLADRLVYDAVLGTVRAETVESARLTVVESAKGAVLHAQTATWNLNTGERQMQGVAPIVIPIQEIPDPDKK